MKRFYDRSSRFSNSGHYSYPALETQDGRIAVPGLLPSPTSTHNSLTKSPISVSMMAGRSEIPSFERPLSPPNSQQQGSSVDAAPLPIIAVTEPQSPGLGPATGTGISDDVGVFHMTPPDLLETVITLRSDVVAKLVQFRNDSRDLCDQHVHFQHAMHELNEGLKIVFEQLSSQNLHQELQLLQSLWAEVSQASTTLNERGEQIQHASKDLSNREERLRRKESSLYQIIAQAQKQPQSHDPQRDEADVKSSSSSSSHPGSEATQPLMVQEYYDKVAQTDSLREEFLNFRENNYRERRRRDRLRSRHLRISPPESEFLANYFRERDSRVEEFSIALAAAHRLRDECRQRGYQVNDVEVPPLGEDETFDAGLLIPQAIVERSASGKQTSKSQNDVEDLLVADIDPKRRVAQWLEKLSKSEKAELSEDSPTLQRQADVSNSDLAILPVAGQELEPPKSKRERSISQPPPSSPTDLRIVKGTPLRLSTNVPVDFDQPRPKSAPAAPIFVVIHEFKNCNT